MSAIPDDLRQFMETLKAPPGVRPVELLARYNDLMNGDPPAVGAFHDAVLLRKIAGWRLNADIAVPEGDGPFPVLVYFHGGGWTMGSPKTHLRLGREYAHAGFLVLNVDYRRAPKHRFPAAFDDCLFATQWAQRHAAEYGGDPARLAVGGDSAGGNLAAAVLAAWDPQAGPRPRAGLLLYGVYDYHQGIADGALGNLLNGADPGSQLYLPPDQYQALRDDPRVNPLRAAASFPPCYIGVGGKDPLLPQSLALAEALRAAEIEHDLHVAEGAPHSFFQLPPLPECAEGLERSRAFLARQLGR